MSMLGKWAPWYSQGLRWNYGPAATYEVAASWLKDLAVEDWGCGHAQFKKFHVGPYVGVDGTAGWADKIVDLVDYTTTTEGLLLRHVIEHNSAWRTVLKNAVASFTKRMVLVVFTPDGGSAVHDLACVEALGVHDYALPFADIDECFAGLQTNKMHFKTATGYTGETMWLVERKAT
jgi:hypothetical protein